MTFQDIADATLMINCGDSRGSGFHFIDEDTVVTNAHVVDPAISGSEPIYLQTESDNQIRGELVDYSTADRYDYAILETRNQFGEQRNVLEPDTERIQRGQNINFAGFPHGIDDLLVHEAPVSGPWNDRGFYIDGSVNGGNSGGPIINPESNDVVGIVTKRRFLGESSMEQATQELGRIRGHFDQMGGSAGVRISGIDFGRFASLSSEAFGVLSSVITANANSGIGIGFYIEYVAQRTKELHE